VRFRPLQRAGYSTVLGKSSAHWCLFVAVALARLFATGSSACAQTVAPNAAELRISGAVSTPLTLTVADLQAMPRKTLMVVNPHEKKTEKYEGVALEEILRKAGVPQGDALRGPAMATYVLAEAADGYRVVFSLAELDAGIADSEVIVADTMDGAPLGDKLGPFRLVAPHEKRPARWVRMLRSITVVRTTAQ
jgi:DMSO/TMAO reductase YedYZ molybdopterin-dependent catalytic subunit